MLTSDSTAAIAGALAAAQAQMRNPVKSRTARVKSDRADYTYEYADLAAVLDAVRPPLAANGIALIQTPTVAPPTMVDGPNGPYRIALLTITTRLMHSSGEWIESELASETDPGERITTLGSAITFLRRYALQAITGVNAEEDDDGGNGEPQRREQRDTRQEPATPPRQAAGPAKAAPKAEAKPAAPAAPAKPDTEMTDLYARLGKLIGKKVAAMVWRQWGTTDQDAERLDVLRRTVAAVDAIYARLDKVTADRLVNDITIDRNDPNDVRGIVADLVEAAQGKPSAPAAPPADEQPPH